MQIYDRLKEIEFGQILLGKYTGLLQVLYADKAIDKDHYREELEFTLNRIIRLSGIDSEEADYIRKEISLIE